ncbi:MAG: hypothetical protein M3P83_11310 [Actinomycetota bacterium]|nr:hypothetical protein [Actinomycetota bacterium]
MRRSLALAGTVLVLGSLAGCGGNETEAYCDSLRDAQREFRALEENQLPRVGEALDRIQELGDQAPDAVSDEWQTLNGAIDELRGAVDDLGIELSDLGNPEALRDLDQQQLREFGERLQDIGSAEVQQASERIADHAQKQCGIDLDRGSGGGS